VKNIDARPILAVVTTTTRLDYLNATLRSLEAAGADDRVRKLVFYQGPGELVGAVAGDLVGWYPVGLADNPIGSMAATLAILKVCRSEWCTDLLLFEDDLVAAPGAVDVMLAADVGGLAFMSFFDSRWLDASEGKENQVLCLYPNRGGPTHYGNLALKIPQATLDRVPELLENPGWDPLRLRRHNADVRLAGLLTSTPAVSEAYGLYCPSLFQHIGHRSVTSPGIGLEDGYGRVAQNFVAGGDARGLSPRPPRVVCMHPRVRTGAPAP
jgi:hypothetical protein